MISPETAWEALEPQLEPLESEQVRRSEAAGRVLTAPLRATLDVPAADLSAMDGYAVGPRIEVGSRLEVAGIVAAGDPPGAQLEAGKALRIMTGAPTPTGTDRIVPIELTDGGRDRVTLREVPPSEAHIRRRGEIVRVGETLFEADTLLTHGALGVLATHGLDRVPVYRRPTVAILTTGDEVVPPETVPGPGQLRDSHGDFLASAAAGLSHVERLGIAPDEPGALTQLVERGLRSDVLLLTGGVSMGEFDLVEDVLEALGCELLFDAVAIQPGKPLVAARHDGGLVFGLPGNPASAMVTYWLFVRPTLHRLQGIPDRFWGDALNGVLAAACVGAKGRDRFLPAQVGFTNGEIRVHPRPPAGSHDLGAYGAGTALLRVPAGSAPAEASAPCQILPLGEWRPTVHSTETQR